MSKPSLKLCLSIVIAAASAGPAFTQPQAAVTAIRAGRLIDGTGKAAVDNVVLVISAGRIEAVGPAATVSIPAGARIVDLSQHTVLPGLIDGHSHPYENLDWTVPDTVRMTYIAQGMRMALLSGTTTYYVLGEIHNMDIVAKDAVDQGRLVGPRIYPSGHWITTTASFGNVLDETYDGPEMIRRKIREQNENGAHHIKLLLESGVRPSPIGRRFAKGQTNFTKEELDAAVNEAHRLGLRVIAHASGDAIRAALDAGADAITHGEELTAELIHLIRQRNTGIVVTHTVGFNRYYPERWRVAGQTSSAKEWLDGWRQSIAKARKNDPAKEKSVQARIADLKAAKAAGVLIAAGTDNGPGLVQMELEFLVEAGFTPLEAISAGTGVTAKLLGIEDEVGTLQKGRFADIIAVRGRPDVNIEDLNELTFVMVGGTDLSAVSWK